ncbi:hypothetical protein [Sulfurovum sp.]|uniref:hypothetical protein n=1 Tax=Sulfurovum sp. TaxID=1969726 RepID=UPI0026005A98|nr:hypothetical protein [Sulfurovum sp.]
MNIKQFIQWFLAIVAIFVLTACGGGGSSTPTVKELAIEKISKYAQNGIEAPTLQDYNDAGITGVTQGSLLQVNTLIELLETKDVNTKDEIQAIVDRYNASLIPKENVAIVDLNTSEVNINSLIGYTLSSSNTEVSAEDSDLNLSKEMQDVVALVDEVGQPVLIGRKYEGEEKVDVSLASSAEMFVLYAPRFNGVQALDAKELSSRIRDHQDFPKLVDAVKYAIDTENPCPLDPICNYQAKELALGIADALELDDLYQEEENK